MDMILKDLSKINGPGTGIQFRLWGMCFIPGGKKPSVGGRQALLRSSLNRRSIRGPVMVPRAAARSRKRRQNQMQCRLGIADERLRALGRTGGIPRRTDWLQAALLSWRLCGENIKNTVVLIIER
jgi:hypothetical protein